LREPGKDFEISVDVMTNSLLRGVGFKGQNNFKIKLNFLQYQKATVPDKMIFLKHELAKK